MAEDAARKPETGTDENANSELAELRAATQRFARRLKAYGLLRTNEDGADAEEDSDALIREGRRLTHELRVRLGELEAKVENSVRQHPVGWMGGILGAIGLGVLVGMLLRHRD